MGAWRGHDDQAAARFLAEHGMVSRMDGDEMVIQAGSEALLPPWPPVVPARTLADQHRRDFEADSVPPAVLCAVCQTPVARHGEAGWRHEVSLVERGGCQTPWPEG